MALRACVGGHDGDVVGDGALYCQVPEIELRSPAGEASANPGALLAVRNFPLVPTILPTFSRVGDASDYFNARTSMEENNVCQ
jgi:hypothetical protein